MGILPLFYPFAFRLWPGVRWGIDADTAISVAQFGAAAGALMLSITCYQVSNLAWLDFNESRAKLHTGRRYAHGGPDISPKAAEEQGYTGLAQG